MPWSWCWGSSAVATSRTSVSAAAPPTLSLANSISGRSDSPAHATSAAKDESPEETRITGPAAKMWVRVPVLPPSMMTEKRVTEVGGTTIEGS